MKNKRKESRFHTALKKVHTKNKMDASVLISIKKRKEGNFKVNLCVIGNDKTQEKQLMSAVERFLEETLSTAMRKTDRKLWPV